MLLPPPQKESRKGSRKHTSKQEYRKVHLQRCFLPLRMKFFFYYFGLIPQWSTLIGNRTLKRCIQIRKVSGYKLLRKCSLRSPTKMKDPILTDPQLCAGNARAKNLSYCCPEDPLGSHPAVLGREEHLCSDVSGVLLQHCTYMCPKIQF